jgi:uncharacterized membrane protein
VSSNLGQAAFRLGFFVVFVSGILLFFQERGTAEHAITQITLVIGLVFLALVTLLVHIGRRKP